MNNFKKNFPVMSRLLIALLIIAVLAGLIWGGWTIAYNAGWVQHAPTLDFDSLIQSKSTPVPTEAPTQAPTEVPTEIPTEAPTAVPTEVPVVHATYTIGKEIKVTINGKKYTIKTFTYAGGYILADDPCLAPEWEKETAESYGRPIDGETLQELIYNWLVEVCKSPHQIIRLRVQMGMISPKSLQKENELARQLATSSAKDYDKVVNETLKCFFKKLSGGHVETSTDWDLENYMAVDDSQEVNLHGRVNNDDDTELEDKDILLTFYAKGASSTFVSNKQGFLNTVNDAKAKKSQFSERAWVNMTEGGTWKWKKKGSSGPVVTPTPKPTKRPKPTSTPKPTKRPKPTPTAAPTSTPRPTKNPEDRPTPPTGGGETNPENSADPQTTDHVESTPAPANTATPAPTATPTPVPTAVVRPTEVCEVPAPPLIREDTYTPPPADGNHNVPVKEVEGTADDSFDPDSI